MKLIINILAILAIGVGLMILVKVGDAIWVSGMRSYRTTTGETVWIPIGRDGYTTMIYLCLLFLLFPIVGLVSTSRRRR